MVDTNPNAQATTPSQNATSDTPNMGGLTLKQREMIIDDVMFFRVRLQRYTSKMRAHPKFKNLLNGLLEVDERLSRGCFELSRAFNIRAACRMVTTGSAALTPKGDSFMGWLNTAAEVFSKRAHIVQKMGFSKASAILFAISQLITKQTHTEYHEESMSENQDLNRLKALAGLPFDKKPIPVIAESKPNFLRELNVHKDSRKKMNESGFKGSRSFMQVAQEKMDAKKKGPKVAARTEKKPVEEAAFPPGQKMRVSGGSGLDSSKVVTVISPQEFMQGEKVEGWYDTPIARGWVPVRMPDGKVSKLPRNRLTPAQAMESLKAKRASRLTSSKVI